MGREWNGVEWGKGRGRENGKVGRWGATMEGGRGEDGRMGWERGCGGSGVEWGGVLGRKEGDVVVV